MTRLLVFAAVVLLLGVLTVLAGYAFGLWILVAVIPLDGALAGVAFGRVLDDQ